MGGHGRARPGHGDPLLWRPVRRASAGHRRRPQPPRETLTVRAVAVVEMADGARLFVRGVCRMIELQQDWHTAHFLSGHDERYNMGTRLTLTIEALAEPYTGQPMDL